jgi:hypothetical protein
MDHLVENGGGFFDGQVSGLEHQGFDGDIAHIKGVQKLLRHLQVFQVRQKILLVPDHIHQECGGATLEPVVFVLSAFVKEQQDVIWISNSQ